VARSVHGIEYDVDGPMRFALPISTATVIGANVARKERRRRTRRPPQGGTQTDDAPRRHTKPLPANVTVPETPRHQRERAP
jgi:hypothetical protein